jgi:putative transcriptional regulator
MAIIRKSLSRIEAEGGGRVDRKKVCATTAEDIERQIAEDPETAPLWTAEELRGARVVDPAQTVDVRAIRKHLRLSQRGFAKRYGFALHEVKAWEEGRSLPARSTRILLRIIDTAPEAVERVLGEV